MKTRRERFAQFQAGNALVREVVIAKLNDEVNARASTGMMCNSHKYLQYLRLKVELEFYIMNKTTPYVSFPPLEELEAEIQAEVDMYKECF